ncbi:MAG: GDP-L-fucose synthase, partial [Alphaproteobacteria bacterium]|nr:GDP-L-fucose synthase [Alphaproteobacteria bacterium]
MDANTKIYVAGHRGLAGSAIVRGLQRAGYSNIITRTHAELDLTLPQPTDDFFSTTKPDVVFLAAAKVGGIVANNTYPADFLRENLAIQNNVIDAAHRHGVARLVFLGSSCIYPRDCPQPIKENYLLTGPLEATNSAYALAKISGVEMCRAYNQQHGTHFLAAMPTNLYGPGDNYDLQHSHVLPALIRKAHEAKQAGAADMVVWGTGTPKRELLYSDDLADALVMLMQLPPPAFQKILTDERWPLINVGCGEDLTIRELAQLAIEQVGFSGQLRFDTTRPDGTPRKVMDVSRIKALGWSPKISLAHGISLAYADYLQRS